jgi:ABC-type dipeptide/oligopeptide/nickel transport system ATPase component
MSGNLLEVTDLSVTFNVHDRKVTPVDGVSLTLERGEALGIAGESGSGKSLSLKSIIGLLPPNATVGGDLRFALDQQAPIPYAPADVHGHGISIIFQEPMTALNPTMRVGDLIAEGPRLHKGMNRKEARERAIELMRLVGIPTPERRARMWPHQLSGGLRQRVMIATALSGARRVDPGSDPRPAPGTARPPGHVDYLREPRPRRARRDLRPAGDHVCRPDRRDRAGR